MKECDGACFPHARLVIGAGREEDEKGPRVLDTPQGRATFDLSSQEGSTNMIPHHPVGDNAWTDEIRAQALIAVRIAATAGHPRTLAYYLRTAQAHGLTVDDLCRAGNLSPAVVRDLTDPALAL